MNPTTTNKPKKINIVIQQMVLHFALNTAIKRSIDLNVNVFFIEMVEVKKSRPNLFQVEIVSVSNIR